MAVRDNKNIALEIIWVLEAGTLVFVLDFIDQSVKAANDILRGSARREMDVSMERLHPNNVQRIAWKQDLESEDNEENNHLLSTGTPIGPNIPRPLAFFNSQLTDLLTRQPLIVPVIPLSHRLRNFNLSLGPDCLLVFGLPLFTPRHSSPAAKLEEL